MNRSLWIRRIVFSLLVVAAAYGVRHFGFDEESPTPVSAPGLAVVSAAPSEGGAKILEAFRDQRSGFMVEVHGVVDRVLPDDNDGHRHQRFVLEVTKDHTVLVAHNIELAPRVPIDRGDPLRLFGQYEWNAKGGVIHWTHRDPKKRHEEGWIEHRGKRYE